ncbi:glycosyltransferase family 2 protein [Streptomyces clavuligerus]|nr:glycosyltransferase [Streptomyces clavuligerus]ANW22210.1 glycosyl transferase [Streptomyces clavuligerus]AXU17102.1 glycosyltransferase family 2 protein [Streptomyces clavuligerus]MBY6307253.1 glycosyltransferase family 2 protein [Streptomyces clavuligerus]QCS10173.1 glycosyltransferase family 2 protein [Streptomyces clavuligerus]QPJ97780.1 glycosyltransferase [Streptomyces clavuligerus]
MSRENSVVKRTVDVVVLTMNDRDQEFRAAMSSVLAQQGVDLRVVIVGNGVTPDYVPEGVQSVALKTNTGIPEGRNVGAQALAAGGAEFVLFFDNDAILPDPHTLTRLIEEFDRHPNAAYVQPRITDPATGETLGRWVPRLRSGDARRSGVVTVMAEGVVLVRRADFAAAGGWPGHFFLFHEGVDLSWRLWDLGKVGWYAGDIEVHHPATNPARHGPFYRMVARNRVWVARRRLPALLVPVYLAVWVVISVWRFRSSKNLSVLFKGLAEGLRGGHGERRPMSWRTVWRLTRAGRPPIV